MDSGGVSFRVFLRVQLRESYFSFVLVLVLDLIVARLPLFSVAELIIVSTCILPPSPYHFTLPASHLPLFMFL